MKKISLGLIAIVAVVLVGHYFIWIIFGISLPAFFPYRNRINQECVQFSGDAYKPIWFNLIYKADTSCMELTK